MNSTPANSKERQGFFSSRTPTRIIQQKDEFWFVPPNREKCIGASRRKTDAHIKA
jgi:hypothetical protein